MKKRPNLLFFGIDSLRADHMSLYGYHRLTTPHLDKLAARGAVFEKHFSPHIPTTPGYSSMFTGLDAFGTDVVALRHKGGLMPQVKTLAEILGSEGYQTTCVGFGGNPASRGFQKYLEFGGWNSWAEGRSPKAERLNQMAIPELERLAADDKPFFLFLRHMDPHAPYLPPLPFEHLFYHGDERDPKNRSLDPVYAFAPFADFFKSWFPPDCTDKDYIIAQYDGAVAYMDACIGNLFAVLERVGIEKETLIVIDSDHGETLYDHECFFDHHGLYDCSLRVPLVFVYPGKVKAGLRVDRTSLVKDIAPTILELMKVKPRVAMDGQSLVPWMSGKKRDEEKEFYITECTWMRKHGWRTPKWKLIHALEPDFHSKPEVELFDLVKDPGENHNVAKSNPAVVKQLEARMQAHIKKREKETGRTNPMFTNLDWHDKGTGPFKTSQEAYDAHRIGSIETAQKLQAALAHDNTKKD